MTQPLWEIFVPAGFPYEHHKHWDRKVTKIAGGITVLKSGKGEWVSPTGKLYKDKIIPVRIKCSREDIIKIIDLTIVHYNQEAVLAYKLSDEVIIRHKG